MTVAWTQERADQKKEKLLAEAKRCMAKLNAKGCVMIAMFEDQTGNIRFLDGGISPMPLHQLYGFLADEATKAHVEKTRADKAKLS